MTRLNESIAQITKQRSFEIPRLPYNTRSPKLMDRSRSEYPVKTPVNPYRPKGNQVEQTVRARSLGFAPRIDQAFQLQEAPPQPSAKTRESEVSP